MGKSAKSVLVFGIYLVGMSLGLIAMPNLVLDSMGFPEVTDVWSRVVGVLALSLAFYYVMAARADMRIFFQWTIYTRVGAFLLFTGFVIAKFAGPMMILLGVVDLAAAMWTAWALRKENQEAGTAVPSIAK